MVEFQTPVLSQMIGGITERILETGCGHFDYSKSSYHMPLLEALGEHVARNSRRAKDFHQSLDAFSEIYPTQ